MTVRELRVGNFINRGIVTAISDDGMVSTIGKREINMFDVGEYEPIPLTKGWLKNFGFVKGDEWGVDRDTWKSVYTYRYRFLRIDWFIGLDGSEKIQYSLYDGEYFELYPLLFIHQLQNIYFAFANEELEIKS